MAITAQSPTHLTRLVIDALQSAQDQGPVSKHLLETTNSSHSLALRGEAASSSTTEKLTPSGNAAFDRSASRATDLMFAKFQGLTHLLGERGFEELLGPWALVLNAMSPIEDTDGPSEAFNAFTAKLQKLSDRLLLNAAKGKALDLRVTGQVKDVDGLARKAFLAQGEKGFTELARTELYPAVVRELAGRNGGTLDNNTDVVAELNQDAVDAFMQGVDLAINDPVGLRTAMLLFFKIPTFLMPPATPEDTPPATPSSDRAASPTFPPAGMPAWGNYNPVTVSPTINPTISPTINFDTAAMAKAFGEVMKELILPMIRELMDRLQQADKLQSGSGSDDSRDSVHGESEDDITSRFELPRIVPKDSADLSRPEPAWVIRSEAPRRLSSSSAPWMERAYCSGGVGSNNVSPLSAKLQHVGAPSSPSTSSSESDEPDRPASPWKISPQGVVIRDSGFANNLVPKLEPGNKARPQVRETIKMSTSATAPTAAFEDLVKNGTDADESAHSQSVRDVRFINKLAKAKGLDHLVNEQVLEVKRR